ncbi:MAG: hypothetical protein ACOX2A_01990 [Tepidanaerobacteraceae bacterium]
MIELKVDFSVRWKTLYCTWRENIVTPYLVFHGNCKDVLGFYQKMFESDIKEPILYGEYVSEGIKTPPSDLNNWI